MAKPDFEALAAEARQISARCRSRADESACAVERAEHKIEQLRELEAQGKDCCPGASQNQAIIRALEYVLNG
jgi:hypothetical protein